MKTIGAYDIDIFIGGGRESIRLCRRGSGFDTAGLDYLIGTRTTFGMEQQVRTNRSRIERVRV